VGTVLAFIETILATIFVLGISVFVHEAGHFVAAKLSGIRVLRFSLGFTKVLLSFKWRGTEYALSLVPLGGYVKMAGGDERESEGKPDEFLAKPPWVRMIVAFAGPAMNFVLAVALFALVAKVGYTLYTFPNRVGEVLDTVTVEGKEAPAPARLAGFEEGDVVVAIEGEATPYWYDLQQQVKAEAGRRLTFDVRRGDRLVRLRANPVLDAETGRGVVGLVPHQANDVFAVADKSAAAEAGVAKGDRLVALDGLAVDSFHEFLGRAEKLPAGRHVVTFRTAAGRAVTVNLEYGETGLDGFLQELGVVCGVVEVRRSASWLGAVPEGLDRTREIIVGIGHGIFWVARGKVKVTKALGGPITIARFAGETARAGFVPYVEYIGFLSAMLAVLNLLPVPLLDGGHIVIGVVETVRRKNLSARARELVNKVGLAFVAVLIALAFFSDLSRVFGWGG
jgi:regulator of sigma E protease